jgi:hypothetical protein
MNDKLKVWLSLSVLTDEEKAGYEISWNNRYVERLSHYHQLITTRTQATINGDIKYE